MNSRIHLSPPDVGDLEEQAVARAVRSGWVAPLGPEVDAFEAELARFCGRDHAVALSSGTAALHLGLLTLGVRPGDVVVTSTMTFAATANAIVYTGAEPVFVDCDETGNMNPDLAEQAFAQLRATGRRVGALVPVDLLGKVADHPALGEVAARYGVPVLSDAAESLGAAREGRPAAAHGAASALSFNGNKVMTTSGGGALLTDDGELAERVRYLATQARQPVPHYEHTDIGYNYRLSNVLAALGRAQLQRLPGMISRRRQNRLFYADLITDLPGISLFAEPSGLAGGPTTDNWWLTAILIDEGAAGIARDQIREAFAAEDIEARPLWKPMHAQPVFAGAASVLDGTSDRLFARGLSLPSGSGLSASDRDRIARCLTGVFGTARG